MAYASGALGALHRLRNRRSLTVAMFHRVLPESDPRWGYSDPEYTISTPIFARCLEFFREHYNVIGVADLLDDSRPLPERALLVTMDDGWSDNEQFALPILRQHGVPAVVFVAAAAIDAQFPLAFWEMRLIHAFRRGFLTVDTCRRLWREAATRGEPAPEFADLADVLDLVTLMEGLPLADLGRILAGIEGHLGESPSDGHLLTTTQIRNLAACRIEIGAHGRSHHPLTRVEDPVEEILASREAVAIAAGRTPLTMSYPHGAYNQATTHAARSAGFRYIFTSDPVVNAVNGSGGPRSYVLGRVGIFHSVVTGPDGEFLPERLALWLFRREAVALSGDRPRRST